MNTVEHPTDIVGSIETGIPIPESDYGIRRSKWKKFYDMNVGESVFVQTTDKKERTSMESTLAGLRRKYKMRMVYRTWEQDGIKGYRVWRVE